MNKPNARYDHAFAIVRINRIYLSNIQSSEDLRYVATVVKILWDEAAAAEEVARLNRINADKDCFYHHQIARIERR